MLYRDFASKEEIDREYNPTLTVGEEAAARHLDRLLAASARQRRRGDARLGVAYGPSEAEILDIYPAGEPRAPVHVFFHGGYWRAFSSADFACVAEALNANGVSAVVVNYALCPSVTIDEIVRQCRAALAWTWHNAGGFGGDPARLSISGHSAGGQLTAMMLATDWREHGLPEDAIRFACPISGLFDLAPFPHSYLQPLLRLDAAQVARNSPLRLEPRVRCPVLVAVGGAETGEFHRQSDEYAAALERHGLAVERIDLAGRNHFTVLDDFLGKGGPLVASMLRRIGASA